jgi:hypothetical protein
VGVCQQRQLNKREMEIRARLSPRVFEGCMGFISCCIAVWVSFVLAVRTDSPSGLGREMRSVVFMCVIRRGRALEGMGNGGWFMALWCSGGCG